MIEKKRNLRGRRKRREEDLTWKEKDKVEVAGNSKVRREREEKSVGETGENKERSGGVGMGKRMI